MVNAEFGDEWYPQLDNINNITKPCELCRKESLSITDERYCVVCYKELLANSILINQKDYSKKHGK